MTGQAASSQLDQAAVSRSLFAAACVSLQRREIPEAIRQFYSAQQSGYHPDQCSAALWECYMLLGDFDGAWRESDAITLRGNHDPHRFWDGKPFDGNSVLVRCLHGLGDAIQYSRYFPLLRAKARHVIFEGPQHLADLFRNMPGVDEVCCWESRPSMPWNQQVELVELPRAFRTTLETIPRPAQLGFHRAIENEPTRPYRRIGLVWAASEWNPARSVSLAELYPILTRRGAEFYSLQLGPDRAQLDAVAPQFRPRDLIGESPTLIATATNMLCLDLLITVDTMAAHLAGTLGIPVWTLLPFVADWRWMLHRTDSPWYPSMTLFRQEEPGSWAGVVSQVAMRLDRHLVNLRAAT